MDFSHELNEKGRDWGFTELLGVVVGKFDSGFKLPGSVEVWYLANLTLDFSGSVVFDKLESGFFLPGSVEVIHKNSPTFPCLLRPNSGIKLLIFSHKTIVLTQGKI